jgi:hypothetical protein
MLRAGLDTGLGGTRDLSMAELAVLAWAFALTRVSIHAAAASVSLPETG